MRCFFNDGCGGFDFVERDVDRADEVDQDALCTVDRRFEQRALNRHLGRFVGLVLAGGFAHAHVCIARVAHDRADVGEVEVDKTLHFDQVGDALNGLTQHVVCDVECVQEGDFLVGDILQAFVRDDDERVHGVAEHFDALFRLIHPALAFKLERFGDNADGQNAELTRDFRNDRRTAGTRAAAHAGGDEDHVGILDQLDDVVFVFFDGFLALFRVCAAALAARDAFADLKHLAGCFQKLLFIGVDGDEFDALQVAGNHAIDRVVAAPADADHFNIDNCIVVEVVFQRHFLFPPAFYNQGFVRF